MPRGYVGQPCWRYLNEVSDAISDAKPVHNQNPFSNLSNRAVSPPSLAPRRNKFPPHTPDTAKSGSFSTGIGNSSNIVVEQNEYDSILTQINQIDDAIGLELYNIVLEIEAMCEVDYVMPLTVPRCLLISNAVKNSLSDFRALTDECLTKVRYFISGIMGVG